MEPQKTSPIEKYVGYAISAIGHTIGYGIAAFGAVTLVALTAGPIAFGYYGFREMRAEAQLEASQWHDEHMIYTKKLLDHYDANSDGVLDAEELDRVLLDGRWVQDSDK